MTPEVDLLSELAEARRRVDELESLVEISPVAVIVMDADERVTDWNPAAAQLFGYSPQEAIGRSIDDLVLDEDLRGEGRDITHEALERGRADRITRRARKDGKLVDVQLMLVPLMTVDGEHVGFYAIYHDITELQRARARAETLLTVTQVLGKTLSLEETIETILDELQRVVPYDSCSVQVIQGNRLVIVGGRGLRRSRGPARSGLRPRRRDQPATARSCGRSGHRSSPTYRENPHFASQEHGGGRIRGWICAPMIVGDRVIGVISVDKFEPDFYNEELGGARDGIRRPGGDRDRERPLARDRARRPRAGRDAPRGGPFAREHAGRAEVFDLILSELRKVVPYRSASVQQFDGDELVIVGGHGYPNLDELIGLRYDWRGPDDPARELVERHETLIVPDVAARFAHFVDSFGEGHIKSWMAVPLLSATG